MSTDEKHELASLYAIGLLAGEELRAFELALIHDPALMTLVAEYAEASSLLALALPRQSAPAGLRQSLLDEAEARQAAQQPVRSGGLPAWIPWSLAAALAVFCGITLVQKSQDDALRGRLESDNQTLTDQVTQLRTERDQIAARLTTLEEEKIALQVRTASLEAREPLKEIHNFDLAPQPKAPAQSAITALWDPARQVGVLDLAKLPPPPPDHDYQLWIIPAGATQPRDAGLLSAAIGARALIQSPEGVTRAGTLAISLEPEGGSIQPQGPVIYVGEL